MYDNGQNGRRTEESFAKRLARWIGILSSLFVVGFLIYWAFHLGRRDASEVPVIAAMEGEARTAPENPGGQQEDYQGLEVNTVLEGHTPDPAGEVNLAPPPDDLADIEPATGEGVEDVELAQEPSQSNEDEQESETALNESDDDAEIVPNTDLVIAAPARRPELLYVPPTSSESSETAPVPSNENNSNADAEAAAIEAAVAEVVEAQSAASEAPEPTPVETPADNGSEPALALSPGTPLIQLAANGDPETTRDQWKQLQAAHSDILGDKSLYVEEALVNGKTFFRLRVSGFGSTQATRDACAALMARNVPCLAVAAN